MTAPYPFLHVLLTDSYPLFKSKRSYISILKQLRAELDSKREKMPDFDELFSLAKEQGFLAKDDITAIPGSLPSTQALRSEEILSNLVSTTLERKRIVQFVNNALVFDEAVKELLATVQVERRIFTRVDFTA
jgi:hypothetical protein